MIDDTEKLLIENKKLLGLLESCPFSIAIYKADGTPDYANESLNRLWNVAPETSLYLMQNYNLLQDEQLKKNGQLEYIKKALTGETVKIPPIQYKYTDTPTTKSTPIRIFWVRSVIFPIKNSLNEVTHLVLMSEDFSERMDFEEKLKNFNKILQDKVEQEVQLSKRKDAIIAEKTKMAAISDTLGSISHHWRQPLNALSWMIQDIEDAYENNEIDSNYIKNFINDSNLLVLQMSEIINDFRNFLSKPESDSFNLNTTLKTVIEEYVNQKNIHLNFSGDDNYKVLGNKEAFTKVLHTLLQNSYEVFQERNISICKLFIQTKKEADLLTISLKDNGGGIKEEQLNRIFDPYYSTKNIKNGTGLSLFMSKIIIEKNMNGNIEVENDNEGAIFKIQLKVV